MILHTDFDKNELKKIARATGVPQTVADVNYAAYLHYHSPDKIYCEWVSGAFILGARNKGFFRIIGMATAKEKQRLGLASILLHRAICFSKVEGYHSIKTLTKSGLEFYLRKGFDIVGYKGDEFYLELKI